MNIDNNNATTTTSMNTISSSLSIENKLSPNNDYDENSMEYDYENSNGNDIDDIDVEKFIVIHPEIEPTLEDYENGYCISDSRMSCGKGGFTGDVDIPCARNTRPE